jgi:hypothetical protein
MVVVAKKRFKFCKTHGPIFFNSNETHEFLELVSSIKVPTSYVAMFKKHVAR